MRIVCLFFGMVVLGLKLEVGAAFALIGLKWSWFPQTVTVAAALFIAYRLLMKPPLAERWKGPDWMAWAIAGSAAVVVLLGRYSPTPLLKWQIGFRAGAVLEELAGLALFGLFVKLAYDTPREEPGETLAERPTLRILLGTWLILLTMVMAPLVSIPLAFTTGLGAAIEGIQELLSGKGLSGPVAWWGWASWGGGAALAWFLLARFEVMSRIPADRPGLGLITWGVVLAILTSIPSLFVSMFEGSRLVFALIGYLVIAGPFAVIGHALLFVGLFRLVSNLQSDAVEEAADGGDAPPLPAKPAPALSAAPLAAPPVTTVAEARAQLAAKPQDAVLHQQLHNLLLIDPAAGAELLAHARDYIALLVKQSRADHAFTILKVCLVKDAAFRPQADQVLPLANLAMARGEPMLALRLMHEFDRLNPGHATAAGVLYLTARVLRAQNKYAPALKVLDQLLQRFPNDPLVPQARSLREALERLAPPPAAPPKPA